MGFDSPSRHQLKCQYPLLNHRLAALISALCFGVLLGSALHRGTNSGTARIHCRFNILVPIAADFISANYPYLHLRQITECAADMKFVVSPQTIKRESTPVDAANALSLLVSEDEGFITADSERGRRLQSKLGIGFKSLWTRRVRTARGLSRPLNTGTFQALL
jgi:hypothetical protein